MEIKDLNLDTMLNSPILGMRDVYRFSGTHFVVKETVADHVASCIGIILKLFSVAPEFDLVQALARMSVHDLGETLTGDVVRPIKYYKPEVKQYFDESEERLLKEHLSDAVVGFVVTAKHKCDKLDSLLTFIDIFDCCLKLRKELLIQGTNLICDKLFDSSVSLEYVFGILKNNWEGTEVLKQCEILLNDIKELVKDE